MTDNPPPDPGTLHGSVPAGWYPDPYKQGQTRYFDGGNWTEHTHSLPQSGPASFPARPHGPAPGYAPGPDRGRRQLITTLVVVAVVVIAVAIAGGIIVAKDHKHDTARATSTTTAASAPSSAASSDETDTAFMDEDTDAQTVVASLKKSYCTGDFTANPIESSGFTDLVCDGPSGTPTSFFIYNSETAADAAIEGSSCDLDMLNLRGPLWEAGTGNPDDAAWLIDKGANKIDCEAY